MTNSRSCVLCSPAPTPFHEDDEEVDLKPFLNPTDQDTQLILTLCKCLDFSIDFNFNCRPTPSDYQDENEDVEFENHHRHDNVNENIEINQNKNKEDNNNVDFDDASSSCSSTATFSSPPSLFCRNCVETLGKFNTLYKQMESLGLEMSSAVSKLISIVLRSKSEEHVQNMDMDMDVDDNNPILSHIEIMKQQLCTRFFPSVNVKKIKRTAPQYLNQKRQRLMNMRNDNGAEIEIVNEVQKRIFNEVQKQRPLLPKLSPQKNRILLLPHPTEPTKLAVFIVKPVGNGNSTTNPKVNLDPNLSVTPVQKPIATETAEVVEPEPEPETDPLQLNEHDKNNANSCYYDNEHMLSLSPPSVRELTWDKLVKCVGTYQYQYRNKWPFTAVPGTPGYDCCCGTRTKNKEQILIHLQKHVPFVHWKTISSQIIAPQQLTPTITKPTPKPKPKPQSKSTSKPQSDAQIVNVTLSPRYRVNVDSTGNKFTYAGKWIFNKVPIYHVDTGEATEKFQFQCETCGKSSIKKTNLITHIRNVHEDPQIFMCDKCPRQFDLKQKLQQHQLTHSNVISFMCSFCGKGYRCKTLLKAHEMSHQDENEREKFSCTWENCKKIFFTKAGLRFHMKGHEGRKFQCDLCGCVYNQKLSLQSHIDVVHDKVIKFTCPVETCKKGFYSRTHYTRHMKSKWVHSGISKKVWSVPKKYRKNKKTETIDEQQVEEEIAMDDEHENGQDQNPSSNPQPEAQPNQNKDENSDSSESEYESESE